MQAEIRENATPHGAWCVIHPLIKKAFANPIGTMWTPLIARFTASKSSVRELMR
jgi:hypothetical protein